MYEAIYDMIIQSTSIAQLTYANAIRKMHLEQGNLTVAQAKLLRNYVELRNRELTLAWATSSV
jgi:hypothetical protein